MSPDWQKLYCTNCHRIKVTELNTSTQLSVGTVTVDEVVQGETSPLPQQPGLTKLPRKPVEGVLQPLSLG
ncbi:hypothetical protein J6590_044303 [Homalodisca vitripennis]|nr:hypothetical protein J6590_044303 [Homalodisca vitripennis]